MNEVWNGGEHVENGRVEGSEDLVGHAVEDKVFEPGKEGQTRFGDFVESRHSAKHVVVLEESQVA